MMNKSTAATLVRIGALSVLLLLTGCPPAAPEKTTNPDEIEQLRQEHEDMSRREMENEG